MKRLPPQDLGMEQGVLGGILLYGEQALWAVSQKLGAEDFYDQRNGLIYRACIGLSQSGHPIDEQTVISRLNYEGNLARIGGPAYLMDIGATVVSPAHIEHYASVIKDKARLRAVIEKLSNATDSAYGFESDPGAALDEVDRTLAEAREAYRAKPRNHAELVNTEFDKFNRRANGERDRTILSLGLYRLDMALSGGLSPGDLMIIAGRPGMGKTGLGLKIASNLAIRQNKCVLFVSYEMPAAQLIGRLACSETLVPTTAWKSGQVDETQHKKLISARRIISEAPMHWLDGRKSTETVAREARYLKARHDLSLVVFDHIQRAARRQETPEIAAVSSSLKDLSLDLGVPVIALSQLNRCVEGRVPPKPQLSDLRGAGDIEQDADIVALLYRPAYYDQDETNQIVELCIAKNRNGPTGMVELLFDSECVRFWEPG